MTERKTVVLPFGVPDGGEGLGLGLAALVHGYGRVEGHAIALAQLHSRSSEESGRGRPVEAFVPPQAWQELAHEGQTPEVDIVLTGAFEPPDEGPGHLHLLAFGAKDGVEQASVEIPVEGDRAGEALVHAFDAVWAKLGTAAVLGGEIGALSWDALESVLRAETCALVDPSRGAPNNRPAALLHFGRAIADAPHSPFLAERLAAIALEASNDPSQRPAAVRALERAISDAPKLAVLHEALAAISLRQGNAVLAAACATAALSLQPRNVRSSALLAEARRVLGDFEGAHGAIEEARRLDPLDPTLLSEMGSVFAAMGKVDDAVAWWRRAISQERSSRSAFHHLAALALRRGDTALGQELVDLALSSNDAPPDVLRLAIQLAVSSEPQGVARASRIVRLSDAFLALVGSDPWVLLQLARAHAELGERDRTVRCLTRIEELEPKSPHAAEAQRTRFGITDPMASLEVEAVLRAAHAAPPEDVPTLAVRARRLAEEHAVWTAPFALGIAERRQEHWGAARAAFEAALRRAPGALAAHVELVAVAVALRDAESALRHARSVIEAEGETSRSLASLATAHLVAGEYPEACAAIEAARKLDPDDPSYRTLAEQIRRGAREERTSWFRTLFGRAEAEEDS